MKKKIKELGSVVILIFISSYLLNFVWESFHAVFLYEGHNFNSMKYVLLINYVAIMDGLLILVAYFIISLLWRNSLWIKQMRKNQIYLFIVIGLIIAIIIEYKAVFLEGRWSYNPLMPTIFGIGLSPLLQLAVTGIISVWFARAFLYKKIID